MNLRIQAFGHAIAGFRTLLATQTHAKFHLTASIIVVGCGIYFGVTREDWIILTICISMVWTAEAINTAIEQLSDEVTTEWRERIKMAKDVAAFSVLAASIGAAISGILVFHPYVIR
jgi:diacylglycerol kinase